MTERKPDGSKDARAKTDDSLRAERMNTDEALKDDVAAAASDADDVVDRARDIADAVLSAAREKADHESVRPGESVEASIGGERAQADREVRADRANADVVLSNDRKDQADTLAALLIHERAATDAYLLTERARSDEAVAHRDDFLAMVAHDVRNLLNLVGLSVAMLRPGKEEPEPHVAAAANRIRRYIARMNRLIGDLVDVTSIDAGKLAIATVEGDAAALVTEATELFQPAAVEKGVTLKAEIPEGRLAAPFDHDRMLQVFANLISNSIKFTPQGGQVTIHVEPVAEGLRFCISDTGVGIAEPMLEVIFERFWQVGKHDRRGMGLGLYISKCIVEAHGGRIWAESQVGSGSQLCFTLPVSS